MPKGAAHPKETAAKRRRASLEIAGVRVRPGESQTVHLEFSESYFGRTVTVPVHVIRSKRSGPRVFLSAVVHGDELNGMGIVRRLMVEEPPKLQRGTLLMLPVVNVFGLEHHTRHVPDRRDLNRNFPGSESGSLARRLAYHVFHEVIAQCDFGIDLHTAAVRRTNFPNVRADLRNPQVKQLAKAFGCELIVNSAGPEGSLRRTATNAGIPTIILEAGEPWKVEPGVLALGVRGVRNVLRSLDMLPGDAKDPFFQATADQTSWVRASNGGMLTFHANVGDFVREGDVIATTYGLLTSEHQPIAAPVDGIVLGAATMPAVKPGEPVYHIAHIAKRTLSRIEKKLDAVGGRPEYRKLQAQLATNLAVQSPTEIDGS